MKKFDVGISEETGTFVATQLTVILSDEYVVFTKLLKFHWNIKGPFFGPLHALFKEGYDMIFEAIDDTAERIAQLQKPVIGTLKEFLHYSRISEGGDDAMLLNANQMLMEISKDLQSLICQMRVVVEMTSTTQYSDCATNNFLTDLVQRLEKYLWKIYSHIE